MPDPSTSTQLGHCAVLFFLTFAHEDAAIVAAAFARTRIGLPLGLAFASVYSGIVASDLCIYGLGRAAQKSAWLRARIVGPGIEQARAWWEAHLVRLVALCRVTPGLLFPAFVACGWFRLPLRRFALVSLASATVYTPLAMALAIWIGDKATRRLGHGDWAMALLLVLALILRGALRQPPWRQAGKSLSEACRPPALAVLPGGLAPRVPAAPGRSAPEGPPRRVARAEHIPCILFYGPLALRWFRLALRHRSLTLPSAANPMIEGGGFWGESKSACMALVDPSQRRWLAPFVTLERGAGEAAADLELGLARLQAAGLGFPVVAKPDIGWQGFGVRLLADAVELRRYLDAFPADARLILQRPVPYDGEAGVFYARFPDEERGRVFSLTLRYFPHVVGDGRSSLRECLRRDPRAGRKAGYYLGRRPEHLGLAAQDLERVPAAGEVVRLAFIGSIRVGGLYRDARHLITPALSRRFDAIARSMPEFHFGRFDIRFESLERLRAGEGFSIFEINGAGSEAIHIWDPKATLATVYRELFAVQDLLFEIGARNRARGFKPTGPWRFLRMAIRQQRLLARYPPSG